MFEMECNIIRFKLGYYFCEERLLQLQNFVLYCGVDVEFFYDDIFYENFVVWLFDLYVFYGDFSVFYFLFMDGGFELILNNNIYYDYELLISGGWLQFEIFFCFENDEFLFEF